MLIAGVSDICVNLFIMDVAIFGLGRLYLETQKPVI